MSFHLSGALRPKRAAIRPRHKDIWRSQKQRAGTRPWHVLTFACSTLNNVAGPSGRLTSHTRRLVLQQPRQEVLLSVNRHLLVRHRKPTDEKGGEMFTGDVVEFIKKKWGGSRRWVFSHALPTGLGCQLWQAVGTDVGGVHAEAFLILICPSN